MDAFKDYFVYKGKAYGIGTKVKISQSANFSIIGAIGTKMKSLDEIKSQTYTFDRGTTGGEYFFSWFEIEEEWSRKHGVRSQVQSRNLENDITEIVEPVEVQLVSWQEKAINNMLGGKTVANVFGGVLIYIVVMCIGAIFQARWGIWLFSTAIFIWWLLNQYRT